MKTSTLGLLKSTVWLTSFFAIYTEVPDIWYAFFVLHGLQGLSVFVLYDTSPKIYYLAYEKIMGTPHPAMQRRKLQLQTHRRFSTTVTAITGLFLPITYSPTLN